jgi:anti-anti-sigma factor
MDALSGRALRIDTSSNGDGICLRVQGDLDLQTVDQLRAALLSALHDHRPTVLRLDLSLVAFCDCTGIGTLCGARLEALRHGSQIVITGTSPLVAYLLALFDLGSLFGYPGPLLVAPQSDRFGPLRWVVRLVPNGFRRKGIGAPDPLRDDQRYSDHSVTHAADPGPAG